jgi:hypothetical protein
MRTRGNDRRGRGLHHVDKWTTFRPGPLHEQSDPARADQYVDVFPYASLAGIDANRLYSRAGPTHIDMHAKARTRGVTLRAPGPDRSREHLIAGSHLGSKKNKKDKKYGG